MNRFGIRHRFFCAAHVRLGDDFQQRCAGAVEVNAAHTLKILVQALACIFFKVRAGHANAFNGAVIQGDIQKAFAYHRVVHLTGLVTLGQVWVEVIFASEDVSHANLGINRQAKLDCLAHGLSVEHRQGAGHTQVDQAGLGVGLSAEGGSAAGEDLRRGGELGVDFQPDDDFPLHSCQSSQ